jgi:hypothetical protein
VILFREEQRPRQPWAWAIVGSITLVAWVLAIYQLVLGLQLGDNPAEDWLMLLVLFFAGLLFPALMLSVKLTVEVRPDGLFLRFRPIHRRFLDLGLDKVIEVRTRTYSPLREFGGWGIRYGRGGTAYNMNGNQGVELTYARNRHVLIGSDRALELENSIRLVWRK